ncbi:arrestin domain-containing protein 3-like isoform 1-T1 [Clarias gariepinus]|uniref:arrestin domain-containing protein 3-like isoform X1 n=1 Tax=Clarias gariepinus TaxID=13013 RepID=UPI00234D05C1|nr:arrestin domain-containing protein 3-like isoform X1 [Clarias gariepinus]
MSPIKELSLTYDPVNECNTFTNGDVINGQVFFEVTKEVKIESLYIKCKGEAHVSWSERSNDNNHTYSAYERYFKLKQYFIQDSSKKGNEEPGVILTCGEIYGNLVKPGRHVYPFRFQLPHGNFPASFQAFHGWVKYTLEVTLDRSWKFDKNDKKEITFVPRMCGVNLMNPQSGFIDKKMKLFTSGNISVKSTINKMGYMKGDIIKVSSEINNSSSRDLKLKYKLEQIQACYAQGHSKIFHQTIFKNVGDPVSSGSKQIVSSDLTLPTDLALSVINCNILKVDYVFKVYLDVPYASDPEIKFPVIILPAGQIFAPGPVQPGFQPGGNPEAPGWNQIPPQPVPWPNAPAAPFGPAPAAPFGPAPAAPFGPASAAPFGPAPAVPFGPAPAAPIGPAPAIYPSPYPSPVCPSSQHPPPSYEALYPNPNSTAPQFNGTASAPPYNSQCPPMNYPNPPFPQQHPVPSAPQFNPGIAGPCHVLPGAPLEYWPNPTPPPEADPTKSPEKHE